MRTLLFLPHVARKWQAAILSDAPIYLVPRRSCDRGKAADFRMPAWSPSPPDTTVNLGAYLWDAQPDIEQQLFTVMRCNGELVTGPLDNEADAVYYATRKDDPWQHHFNPGIAAACLAQLYRVTGESQWLDAARNFQEFSMTTDPCQFRSMQVCKSGWGSGMLYVATRETQYRNWTARLGDWFVENQQEDGYWKSTAHWTPEPTLADLIEATAEFVGHTARIESFLSV